MAAVVIDAAATVAALLIFSMLVAESWVCVCAAAGRLATKADVEVIERRAARVVSLR